MPHYLRRAPTPFVDSMIVLGISIVPLIYFGVLWLAIIFATSARGAEHYPGQYAQVDPEMRRWFRNQMSPKTGGSCCSEADGTYAEEDIRGDHYWTRFPASNGVWVQVPEDVVINAPNRNGAAVVWWYFEASTDDGSMVLKVRCYAPGGKA